MAKTKRIVAIILTLVMFMQGMPVAALADAMYSNVNRGGSYHQVSFLDMNGGVLVTQYVTQGSTPVVPDVPDVEGYEFQCWTVGGGRVDPGSYAISGPTTFQASYEKVVTYTVSIRYVYNDAQQTPAFPTWVKEYTKGTHAVDSVDSPADSLSTPDQAVVSFDIASIGENVSYTVVYTVQPVTYTVKHLGQNAHDNAYGTQLAADEVKTGYPNQQTEAVALTGVTGFTAKDFHQATIAGSGNTVVTIEYDRNVHSLNVVSNGGTYTSGGVSGQTVAGGTRRYGANLGLPDTMEKVGSTFVGWVGSDGKTYNSSSVMPDYDLEVTAQWEANTTASYTVVYWQEKVPSSITTVDSTDYTGGYDFVESVPRSGTVGEVATYQNKSYTGFKSSPVHVVTPEIAADGSTVVNVYYARQVYTITFMVKSWNSWSADSSRAISAKYMTDISDAWGTSIGDYKAYTTKSGSTMYSLVPNMGNTNFTVYLRSNSGSYDVVYYIEELDGSYTEYDRLTKIDFTNLTEEDKQNIEGFTFAGWHKNAGNRVDAPDGERITGAWLKYSRNTYKISFANCAGVGDASVKYEAVISSANPGTPGKPANVFSECTFGGWYTSPACEPGTEVNWNSTMPAHNLVYYAKWNQPTYTVTFYKNDGSAGSLYSETVEREKVLLNVPGDPSRAAQGDVTYTFTGWYTDAAGTVPFDPTTPITSDKSVYAGWKQSGKFTYNIVCQEEGGKIIQTIPGKQVDAGDAVTLSAAEIPAIPGYVAVTQAVNTVITQNGQDIIITYRVNNSWGLTVKYLEQGTDKVLADEYTEQVLSKQKIVTAKSIAGYNVVGSVTQTATEANHAIIFYYQPIIERPYYVQFYVQNDTGAYDLKEIKTYTGKLGSHVEAFAEEENRYVSDTHFFDASHAGTVLKGNIGTEGNGGVLTLKLYFSYHAANYIIHHYLTGTTTSVAPDQTGSKRVGEYVSAMYSSDIYAAYDGVAFSSFAPSNEIQISADASKNVIIVYYSASLVITADNAEQLYNGQPLTQPGFAVTGMVGSDTQADFALRMTADSTITDAGSVPNVVDRGTVTYKGGAIPSYYNVSYNDGTLTVTKRTVKLISATDSKVYDGEPLTNPAVTIEGDGFVEGEMTVEATGSITEAGSVENPIKRTEGANFNEKNYVITEELGTLTVTKNGELSVSGTPYSGKYDGAFHGEAATASVTEGTTITYIVNDVESAEFPTIKDVGVISVTVKATNPNYVTATATYTLTVTPRVVTLTSVTASKVYDGAPLTAPNVMVGGEGFVDGEMTVLATGTITDVGSVPNPIQRTEGMNFKPTNYSITETIGTLTVTLSNELTVSGTPYSGKYDGKSHGMAAKASVTAGTTITYIVDGVESSSYPTIKDVGVISVTVKATNPNYTTATATYTLEVTPRIVTLTSVTASKIYDGTSLRRPDVVVGGDGFVAGEMTVRATGRITNAGRIKNNIERTPGANFNAENYVIIESIGTLTVSRKVVTVTADAKTKVFGNADPELTAVVEGVIDDSQITYTLSREPGEDVGVYTITPTGNMMQGNYIITYVENELTILPKAVTLTADAKTKVYGDADPELTATVTGVIDGYEIEYTLSREAGEEVGSYTITPAGETYQGNYEVTYIENELTITPKAVTVTADAKTKVYGDADPELTATVEGVIDEYVIEYTLSREAGEDIGTYTITPAGETYQGNYEVSYIENELTILPKAVTVTADAKTKVFGDADPELTAVVEGVIDEYVIEYTLSREAGEDVGSYTITPAGETYQGNYEVTYIENELTITPKAVTVTADAKTKVFGDADPELTAVVEGVIDEFVIEYTLSREPGEDIGTYTITPAGETYQGNYEVTYIENELTILPKAVTVTADAKTKVYGDADPELTATVAGVIDGYELVYTLSREPGEDIGTYTITPAGEAYQGNYEVTYIENELTILPKVVTVTADAKTKVYGEADPELTAVVEGVIDEYVIEYTLSREEGEDVGEYAITPEGETYQGNYEVVYVENVLTITPKAVTVTAEDKRKAYGAFDPELTAIVEGVIDEFVIEYTLSREEGEAVGEYAITPEGEEIQGNYIVTYVPGTLVIYMPYYNLTINYWYGSVGGATAAPSFYKRAALGVEYNVASPVILGYTADISRVTGTFTRDVTYDVVYTPNAYTLTIRYIYQDGTTAAETYTRTLYSGYEYSVDSPAIPDYKPSIATVSGRMEARDVTFTVVYTRQNNGPDTTIIDEYGVPLGLGNVQINVGDCFE